MYINYIDTDDKENTWVYCGGKYHIVPAKIPSKYHNNDVLELAGLKDEISNNYIVQLKHGFKSVKEDYVVAFLIHPCKKSENFVDVIPRDQIGEYANYLPKDVDCLYTCFIGKTSLIDEVI